MSNNIKEQYIKFSLIAIIIVMGIVLLREITPFTGGLLGAFTIYILVRKQMARLTTKKHMKRSKAAALITCEVLFFFLVPLSCTVWLIINRLETVHLSVDSIIAPIQEAENYIKARFGFDILGNNAVSWMVSKAPEIGQAIMGEISSFLINVFVVVFVLYFMLTGGYAMENYIRDILPFTPENKQHVLNKVRVIVRSNAIGVPLLAIIEGGIATIGYLIFGVPSLVLWGLLTCVATVIPVVGTSVIWIPLAIYMALSGKWFDAIGLVAYGVIVVAQLDNFIRFLLQKKLANIHPLITIFGVIIGLAIFGFMGIIFGPLLLSLFFLFVDMFKKEYLDSKNN